MMILLHAHITALMKKIAHQQVTGIGLRMKFRCQQSVFFVWIKKIWTPFLYIDCYWLARWNRHINAAKTETIKFINESYLLSLVITLSFWVITRRRPQNFDVANYFARSINEVLRCTNQLFYFENLPSCRSMLLFWVYTCTKSWDNATVLSLHLHKVF